ncbi:hypothetical protein CC86DRAFT_189879 [Ophiobolus disseminans]|uniref:Uncharacterized protein n=1 Tax=Ophiobolus disseminans TaxID=1469910 RepID=A0A6A7A9N6_9PLEO|nr:hypothetical protein CC86DRAFT_189879 [Ophiobolus disseminans]
MSVVNVGDVIRLCELAGRVYKNCRDCPGAFKTLTTEARSLKSVLEDINDKFEKIPESKRAQLIDAYEPCIDVLKELDTLLNHYNGLDTKTKRAWERFKWDPEKARSLRERLTSSVAMLSAFYTSLIHDNQVLILEALERLEHDYRGGHREESIASLERITSGTVEDEEEEEEAAWTQILRDLEDVGVAKQDALSYRDLIVDWLVTAVNEGRLLEQREPESFLSMPRDLGSALPQSGGVDLPGTHHLDVPAMIPSYERSQSAPFWSPPPLLTPSEPQHQRAHSIPSTVTPSLPELSGVSSYAPSNSPETDASSLYATLEPVYRVASVDLSNAAQIRRVPVPTRQSEPPSFPDRPPSFTTPMALSLASMSDSASSPSYSPPVRSPPPIPPKSPVPSSPAFPPVSEPLYAATSFSVPPLSLKPTASATLPNYPIPVASLSPALQYPHADSAPPVLQTPPDYYDKYDTVTVDLAWTSQQIIAAWSRKDFTAASRHLEDQLAAVERGHTVISTGLQPDRRILRHLLGVCNSFTGNFEKAKRYFESVFNTVHFNRQNLDDGDVAAARWLGDVCLHLREHSNAVLAWGIAHEGSIGRYGIVRDRTRRIGEELRLLDHWLFVFQRIGNSFLNNVDPTDIFRQTHAYEKSNLITALRAHLYEHQAFQQTRVAPPPNIAFFPTFLLGGRPKLDINISEGFLLAPLISVSSWPLAWDSTFSPTDAVQLDRNMNTVRTNTTIIPLIQRNLPSLSLGASNKLHYVTKRGSQWLIETVKQCLQELCIEHAEHSSDASIVCTLNQHRDGFAFSEGVKISFKKLQFRSIHGLQVSDVLWSTRHLAIQSKDTQDFRVILKSLVEGVENEAASFGLS